MIADNKKEMKMSYKENNDFVAAYAGLVELLVKNGAIITKNHYTYVNDNHIDIRFEMPEGEFNKRISGMLDAFDKICAGNQIKLRSWDGRVHMRGAGDSDSVELEITATSTNPDMERCTP